MAMSVALVMGSLTACTPSPDEPPIVVAGDAIGGPLIADELGTYQKLLVNPDGQALVADEATVDMDSFAQYGLTSEDAQHAQAVTAKYLIEDFLDNIVIDLPDASIDAAHQKWFDENRESIFTGDWALDIDGFSTGRHLIVMMEGMPRDGKPRFDTIEVKVTNVVAEDAQNIRVFTETVAGYRVSDAYINEGREKRGLDSSDDDQGILSDGIPNVLTISRGADVRVDTTEWLIGGVTFGASDFGDIFAVENIRNSKW